MTNQALLKSIFNAGLASVSGNRSLVIALPHRADFKPDRIIAVGKAASDMYLGAQQLYGRSTPAIVVTKYQHSHAELSKNPYVTLVESGHPVPDEHSLLAGKLLLDSVRTLPADSRLLLLVSGGASALAESLPEDMALADWQDMNQKLLASGLDIAHINRSRKSISRIKDGRLLQHFRGHQVIVCAISDVQGDSISTIGSGIGDINRCEAANEVMLVATNQTARIAAEHQAQELGFNVRRNEESLYDDVFRLATKIGRFLLRADKGVYIWGGEPTIVLPENPGQGGRNQSLGLALAKEISGTDHIHILVAGTDGSDGPTDAAGAIVDGTTFRYPCEAQAALNAANAGDYLETVGAQFITGPTGTNVMDLMIAIVD